MSLTWVGLAITAHSLADLVSKSSAGFFLDRYPARVVLGVLMGVSLLGLVLLPFARDAGLFLLSLRFLALGFPLYGCLQWDLWKKGVGVLRWAPCMLFGSWAQGAA